MIWLFTYGVLADPEEMVEVLGQRPEGSPASIAGYRREYSTRHRYHYLVPDPRGRVEGVAWRVPEVMLPEVDDFEDVEAGLYERVPVEILLAGDGRVEGYTYVGGTIAEEATAEGGA